MPVGVRRKSIYSAQSAREIAPVDAPAFLDDGGHKEINMVCPPADQPTKYDSIRGGRYCPVKANPNRFV